MAASPSVRSVATPAWGFSARVGHDAHAPLHTACAPRCAGLPPIMNFGSKYLQDKVVKDCLQGKKFICLAITEPLAGSDVAGLRTTAVKDPSGKFYVVNGEKKWCVRAGLLQRCAANAADAQRLTCVPVRCRMAAQDHERRVLRLLCVAHAAMGGLHLSLWAVLTRCAVLPPTLPQSPSPCARAARAPAA